MCDYSLHFVASRPAKVGDRLVSTRFRNSITRGFAAIGEPHIAVCLLPGTELAFENEVEYDAWLLPTESKGQAEGGSIPEGQQRAAAPTSRCARIPRWADRATHAIVRRPARDRAAVARLPTHQKPDRGEQAELSRRLMT